MGNTVENWALTDSGIWECGECHHLTTETHFYRDRATGEMHHQRNPEARQVAADRCGWSFDYDYGGVMRCALRHGHFAEPKLRGGTWIKRMVHNPWVHGYGVFGEDGHGAIPPAVLSHDAIDGGASG